MALAEYLPNNVLGITVELHEETHPTAMPRMYATTFDMGVCSLSNAAASIDVLVIGSNMRPDMRMLEAALRAATGASELPAIAVCPSFDSWQKEKLSARGAAFIQDERNAYLPFMGLVAADRRAARQPAPLSPQAQRIVVNLLEGIWDGLSAGELAERLGKSRASVSKYLAEIEAVCPSAVVSSGRARTVNVPDMNYEAFLNIFEPYLRSPIIKTLHISSAVPPDELSRCGLRACGLGALESCTDLAFGAEAHQTAAAPYETLERVLRELGRGEDIRLPWWDDGGIEIEAWSYWDDIAVPGGGMLPGGMDSVGHVSLYLSLRGRYEDDVCVSDAIEQLREAICRG